MKKALLTTITLLFVLVSLRSFAQVPVITYSPASSPSSPITLTQNSTNNLPITATSNPAVGAFGYALNPNWTLTGLTFPWGIGIDPSDKIYVTNYTANPSQTHQKGIGGSISKYSSSGASQGAYGGANLQQPTGIVFDSNGNGYILNYSLMDNGNLKGTAYIEQYSSSGADNGATISGLGYPATGLAIDASNNLYVASGSGSSSSNISEYVIGNSNPFLVITAPTGSNFSAVGVDGSYNIYALDNAKNQVLEYNSTGTLIKTVLTGLNSPKAFYVDGGGDIFVGNSGNGTVTIYNPSPSLTAPNNLFTISGFSDPRGIATDSKGYLYVSDIGNNTVKQFVPTGGYFIKGKLPAGLTFDSTNGTISGAPTSGFPVTTYYITGWNASGSSTTSVTLYCMSNLSIYYDPSVYIFTIGSAIPVNPTPTVTKTSNASVTFAISPTLPTGLSIDKNTGIITGTVATSVSAASTPTIYTVTATQGGSTATTNISILCVKDNYWTGNTNTDWNTGSNWSAGTVPTSSQNATIGVHDYPIGTNTVRNDPVVSTNTQAYIVTFGAATNTPILTVQNGATFTLNTVLTVNTGSTPSFVTGSSGGSIILVPAALMYVNGNLTTSDNLITLQSTASGSASVGTIPTGASVTGKVSVQRYLPAYRGWVLLTSPVNAGAVTTGSNTTSVYDLSYLLNSTWVSGTGFTTSGFSKNGNPSLFLYRENFKGTGLGYAQSNYRAVTSIPTTTPPTVTTLDGTFSVPIANGYELYFRGGTGTPTPFVNGTVAYPATLTATGTLNQGSITYTNWDTPSTPGLLYSTTSGSANIEGFNLVGNPYACTIDLSTYNSGGISMTNVATSVYELNSSTGNYGVYSLDGSVAPTNYASQYIVSGQGFFVQATGSSSSLTFNETCKKESKQNTSPYLLLSKSPIANTVPQYLRLHLALDSINSDETIIKFNDQAKTGYVFNEDALYMTGNGKVALASLSSDNLPMAINTRPLAARGDTVKLKVSAANGTYSISINAITGVPQLYDIWLMDAYKKDSVDLRHGTYSFEVNRADTNSYGSNRFKLIMRQNPALAYHLINFMASKATGRQVQLVWTTENEANYTNFTVQRSTDGGKTYDVVGGVPSTGAGQYALMDKNPGENNLYRLQQIDINNNITYSNIIPIGFAKQNGNLANSAINVYPNPASGTIDLAVKEEVAGAAASYRIRIVSSTGLVVKEVISSQASWHGNISSLLPGTYIVRVMNDKTQSFVGESKLIKL